MTKKKPALAKLSDLAPGDYADFFVQLAHKARGSTRDGKPFVTCKFRDARRTVGAVPFWNDSAQFAEALDWQVGQFFKVRGTFNDNEKYGPQIEIEQIRAVVEADRATGFSELDFAERSRFDASAMLADLEALVSAEIADAPLRALVLNLLSEHAAALKALPGSARRYYTFAGGWLEHTLSVARSCGWLATKYAEQFPELHPPLNRGLVTAAAVLHDIGRVRELDAPPGLPVKDTVPGELFGHLYLAYDLIRAAAARVPDLNPELLDLLLHCVITHQKLPAWGSASFPCVPEVLILHHADDLDAKFEMFVRHLTRDTNEGAFTAHDPNIGRPLLKRRDV